MPADDRLHRQKKKKKKLRSIFRVFSLAFMRAVFYTEERKISGRPLGCIENSL